MPQLLQHILTENEITSQIQVQNTSEYVVM